MARHSLRIGIFFTLLFTALSLCPLQYSEAKTSLSPTEASAAIEPVKTFYEAVNDKNYALAWSVLTKRTQDKFISMVAEDEKMALKKVRDLFENNAIPIQKGFWNSFREASKVMTLLPKAHYTVLSSKGKMAVVELSDDSQKLDSKAFKENGKWKLGYAESFLLK